MPNFYGIFIESEYVIGPAPGAYVASVCAELHSTQEEERRARAAGVEILEY